MVVKPCSSFFLQHQQNAKEQASANNQTTASINNKAKSLSRSQIIMSRHAFSASILMSLKHKKRPYKGKQKQTSTKESRLNV